MNEARKITLKSPEDTTALAAALGPDLRPGDVILLQGAIGSGKTHFARSLIQSVMEIVEDVPSPTFTLVQVYDTAIGEIWHSDLYRLTSVDEIEELGLTEAFDSSICLIEWPEKLESLTPDAALTLRFEPDPEQVEARHVWPSWTDARWTQRLEAIQ